MSIFNHFQHLQLTQDQENALVMIENFMKSKDEVFILKGYAGTGKTTLIQGITNYLAALNQKYLLLTPTGRAAKVLGAKTGKPASTIHRCIYGFEDLKEIESEDLGEFISYVYYFEVGSIDSIDNLIIVDEASMVSDFESLQETIRFGSGKLLSDLLNFSRIQNQTLNNKIIFVGDPAQLPPIGMNFSPALDKNYLEKSYSLNVVETELKEVKRQDDLSGILTAASKIRRCLTSGFFTEFDLRENAKDIFNIKLPELLSTYNQVQGSKIVISYKNETALAINEKIRLNKYGADLPIQSGDQIIVGANNYKHNILNGEIGIITQCGTETITRKITFNKKGGGYYNINLTWRKIEILFPDSLGSDKVVSGYFFENYLYGNSDTDLLERLALYIDFKNRFSDSYKSITVGRIPGPKTNEFKQAIRNDDFHSPIMLKYGYAITCHKAQGGEWDTVFTCWDRGTEDFFKDEATINETQAKSNPEFYKWAYTAVTRAVGCLFCINPPYFNSYSKMVFINEMIREGLENLESGKKSTEVIEINSEVKEDMERLGLSDISETLKYHFIKMHHLSKLKNISIIRWEQVGYEIRYYFKSEKDIAAVKTWVNNEINFTATRLKIEAHTNSHDLYTVVEELFDETKNLVIYSNTINDENNCKIEFSQELIEEKPFLKILFDDLYNYCGHENIFIIQIEHKKNRERYTLKRGSEIAHIDFEYNDKGFFGRVLPIKKVDCENLLSVVEKIISKLKLQSNVI